MNERRLEALPGGWSLSIIRGPFTYGGPQGLWEVAVLGADGKIVPDLVRGGDVAGWLTDEDVAVVLASLRDTLPGGAA